MQVPKFGVGRDSRPGERNSRTSGPGSGATSFALHDGSADKIALIVELGRSAVHEGQLFPRTGKPQLQPRLLAARLISTVLQRQALRI